MRDLIPFLALLTATEGPPPLPSVLDLRAMRPEDDVPSGDDFAQLAARALGNARDLATAKREQLEAEARLWSDGEALAGLLARCLGGALEPDDDDDHGDEDHAA